MTTPAPVPPDTAPPDVLRMMEQRLQALVQQNVKDIQELQRGGFTFDMGQVLNGRIDTLIRSVAMIIGPNGPAWELQAKIAFEEGMAQNIEVAKTQGRTAQLAQAGSFSASDIRKMAQATNTYGGR